MAKKRGERVDSVAGEASTENNEQQAPTPAAEETAMAEQTTPANMPVDADNGDDDDVVELDETGTLQGRRPLDMLADDCPSKELRARFSDDERALLRGFYDAGQIARTVRAIEISKNPTGKTQYQPYYAYYPILTATTGPDGEMFVDVRPMFYLSNQKLGMHFRWKALKQVADTPEKEAQKQQDETWGIASHYDHGLDLKVRQNVRAHLNGELLGPIGEIAKAVRALFVNDVAETKQEAFDMVVGKRVQRGMPVPENLTLEGLGIQWPDAKSRR